MQLRMNSIRRKLCQARLASRNIPFIRWSVGFPIGLWVFALVCDAVHAAGSSAAWRTVGTFCVAGGIVGAPLAAVPGVIEYFSIHEAEMKRIANLHLFDAIIIGTAVGVRLRCGACPLQPLLPACSRTKRTNAVDPG